MAITFPNVPTAQTYRAPGPYDEDYRSIARREQMAQILQQQALQPIEAGSYQGIQAPISPLSGIAKVLQGYFAGKQGDEADQARQELAFKAENNKRALVGAPPLETNKSQQLAQALQTNPATPTELPVPQTTPVAQSFPIGPSGADQNLPPVQEMPQNAPQDMPQISAVQGAANMPTTQNAPQGQFKPFANKAAIPSVTGDPLKDLEILNYFGGDTGAYIKFAYNQNKPLVGGPGSTIITPAGKQITSLPDEKGNVRIQNPDGTYRIEKAGGVSELQRSEAYQKEYATQGAKATVERDVAHFGLADAAPQNIEKANRIIDLVESGALTGTAAEKKLQVARLFNITGNGPEDTIKKTELLLSGLGQNVLDNIKASGLGAGQGFTNTDRQFLERVVGGSIELNGETLKELARLQKLSNQRNVEKWNKRVGEIDPNVRKDMGFKPIELGNTYSQSEIQAEARRRGLIP